MDDTSEGDFTSWRWLNSLDGSRAGGLRAQSALIEYLNSLRQLQVAYVRHHHRLAAPDGLRPLDRLTLLKKEVVEPAFANGFTGRRPSLDAKDPQRSAEETHLETL